MFDIPADDPAWDTYKGAAWMEDPSVSDDTKAYAAMVTMVDRNVGEILDLLAELKLEDNTIVIFTGDNGAADYFRSQDKPRGFFGGNVNPETGVEFRGTKRLLYDGGLRIPFLVRWPGKVEAGRVSDLVFAQYDMLATLADLTGTEAPEDTDGISILPTIFGEGKQALHDFFYWEYGGQFAVRQGDWKAVKPRPKKGEGAWELYDLSKDVSESNDLATEQPKVLAKLIALAEAAHTEERPGRFADPERVDHERDRWAKWGTSKDQP